MFDPEFFPTPPAVIAMMLHPYRPKTDVGRCDNRMLQEMTILDPSAGSGSMLKFIHSLFSQHQDKPTLHAIEHNPDMQPLLREQFTFVHDDFLTFHSDVRYDLILMNPPFSNGDAHLEKAWEVMQHGDIVCLLNAETLRNPYSQRRQWLVQLIEEHGSVEFIGQAFKNSQRPTDVEVALVRLKKHDEHGRFDFWEDDQFAPEEQDFSFTEQGMADMPAVNNKIAVMVQQYQLAQRAFVDYLKAYKRLEYHALPLIGGPKKGMNDLLHEALKQETGKQAYNTFVTELQRDAWNLIIERTDLRDLMSQGVRKDFDAMRKAQGGMPLTEANIRALLEMLSLNRATILQRCVEEAFDLMTRYHDGNHSHYEGWKSNNAFKVNRKVIIPGYAVTWESRWGGSWSMNYNRQNEWLDIDRACAMLEGKRLSSPTSMKHMAKDDRPYRSSQRTVVTIYDALAGRLHELAHLDKYQHYVDNVCESEYFHIKFWKKGTAHLVFKDEGLWQRFNQQAALGKKWLPNNPGDAPMPKPDPAEQRYAKRLEADNMENRKLLIAA